MKARKSNSFELECALKAVNKMYGDNIKFRRLEYPNFTLKVLDSRGPGSAISASGRRTGSACWHVHGHFFDELFAINPDAYVISRGVRVDINGGNWDDWVIHQSYKYGTFLCSELCDCQPR